MKSNDKIATALFNAAFGSVVLDRAVFQSGQAITRDDAMLALVAGYLAGESIKSGAVPTSIGEWIAKADTLLATKKTQRTDMQQKIYMRAVAKYNYYFGEGASNGTSQKASKKNADNQNKIWYEIAAGLKTLTAKEQSSFNRELAALRAKYGI